MDQTKEADYLLTMVQHTFCRDCVWLKNKITDVYHASGMARGSDSERWRVQILSPPWNREQRRKEFPRGFKTVDVPALKLEINNKIVLATQNGALISDLLVALKRLLIGRYSNIEIGENLLKLANAWVERPTDNTCALDPVPSVELEKAARPKQTA